MNLLVTLGTVDAETWKTVGIVAGILAGIALVLVIAILVIGKVFKVDVDEKVTKILENLAGANCGGCGCSGCSGFAQQLACGKADLSACHVTSPEKKAEIAELLGITVAEEEPSVAIVKCHGGNENAHDAFEYAGNPTCAACNTLWAATRCAKRPALAAATAPPPAPNTQSRCRAGWQKLFPKGAHRAGRA